MSVAASPDVLCPPTHLWVPPGSTFEAGAEAGDLARSLGFDVEQPEQDALNVLLAESPDGDWAALETGIVAPRQQIKTAMLEVTCWLDLLVRDVRRVTWSAHLYKTTRDAFTDMKRVVESHDWVASRVDKVRDSNGEEGFDFVNGATMDFLARSKGSGRGLGGDTVVLDEALFLSTDTQGALIPTLSTARKAHVRYGSSPGKLESTALRSLRDRARTLADPTLTWVEWSTPEVACADPDCRHDLDTAGCMLDDEAAWARVNPALDRRVTRKYVRAERRSLSTDPWEFLRERMGVWQDPVDGDADVVLAGWSARANLAAAPGSPLRFGVDVAMHMAAAAIVACGPGPDGMPVLELVEHRKGTRWVAERLAELRASHKPAVVGVMGGSPALALELPDVQVLTAAEVTSACAGFARDVSEGAMWHRDQTVLNAAALGARRRAWGDQWRWSRAGSDVDISPIAAATVAHWLTVAGATPVYDPLDSIL